MPEPTYLGDGVYVKVTEDGDVVLTTGSHLDADAENRIILEPKVLANLDHWLEKYADKWGFE